MDFALAHGLNPILETDFGNPLYKGGGGRDLAAGFPYGDEGLSAWDRWVDALSRHFAPMENPATKQQSVGRRVRTVTLIPLEADDRDQFVRDNQASFNYGAFVVRRQS